MRSKSGTSAVLVALLLGSASAGSDPVHARPNRDSITVLQCEIALDYVEAVTAGVESGSAVFAGEEAARGVIDCANVRKLLGSRGIAFGRTAVERAMTVRSLGPFRAAVLSATIPTVTRDKREAVLQTGMATAPFGGEEHETRMRRNETGRWVIVSRVQTAIS